MGGNCCERRRLEREEEAAVEVENRDSNFSKTGRQLERFSRLLIYRRASIRENLINSKTHRGIIVQKFTEPIFMKPIFGRLRIP